MLILIVNLSTFFSFFNNLINENHQCPYLASNKRKVRKWNESDLMWFFLRKHTVEKRPKNEEKMHQKIQIQWKMSSISIQNHKESSFCFQFFREHSFSMKYQQEIQSKCARFSESWKWSFPSNHTLTTSFHELINIKETTNNSQTKRKREKRYSRIIFSDESGLIRGQMEDNRLEMIGIQEKKKNMIRIWMYRSINMFK